MLSINECKSYLKNQNLKDEEVECVRKFLYALSNRVIDVELKKNDRRSKKN